MTRTEARELLMQAVFQMEAQKDSSNELFEQLLAEQMKISEEMLWKLMIE